jgi:tRNA (guanine10-N2)-methyltransferase
VTIKKTTCDEYPRPVFGAKDGSFDAGGLHVPAHKDFREKYFQGFQKGEVSKVCRPENV